MIRDITLGQYYKTESIIHSLDPRTKIIVITIFIVSLFLGTDFFTYPLAILFLGLIIYLSRVPLSFMLKGLKSIFIIIIITVLLNLFFTKTGTVLFAWRWFVITSGGIRLAFFMGLRLTMLIIGSSVLTLTTTPLSLTDGLEKLLKPLEKIRVPAHEIAMMMTISLRFIPILLEETDKIMKAQMARGADFNSGGFVQKAKNMIPILVPLFVSAFRKARDLALAMEARCYRGGEGRTRMKELRYKKIDSLSFLLSILYLLLIIFMPSILFMIFGRDILEGIDLLSGTMGLVSQVNSYALGSVNILTNIASDYLLGGYYV